MSRNMGPITNTDSNTKTDRGWHESPGLVVRTICPICQRRKHSSQPHPKCSREMQRLSRLGVVL